MKGIPSEKTFKTVFSPVEAYLSSAFRGVSCDWSKMYVIEGQQIQEFYRLRATLCYPQGSPGVEELISRLRADVAAIFMEVSAHVDRVRSVSRGVHLFYAEGEKSVDANVNLIPYSYWSAAEIVRQYCLNGGKIAGRGFEFGGTQMRLPRVVNVDQSRHPLGELAELKFRVSTIDEVYEHSVRMVTDLKLGNETGITIRMTESTILDAQRQGLIRDVNDLRGRRVHTMARRLWPAIFVHGVLHSSYQVERFIDFID